MLMLDWEALHLPQADSLPFPKAENLMSVILPLISLTFTFNPLRILQKESFFWISPFLAKPQITIPIHNFLVESLHYVLVGLFSPPL